MDPVGMNKGIGQKPVAILEMLYIISIKSKPPEYLPVIECQHRYYYGNSNNYNGY
jgi:hypothetical protein